MRAGDGLTAGFDVQLAVERVDVPLHGAHGDGQRLRDLLVGMPRHDQPQHFEFALAQRLDLLSALPR